VFSVSLSISILQAKIFLFRVDLIPGNICGRLTHIIEEEREDRGSGDRNAGSSSSLTEAGLDGVEDIKYVLLDEIKTMMEEIKAQDMNYAQQALEQIHSK
jgi:hypothetical protein